jgi:hypothetical protein
MVNVLESWSGHKGEVLVNSGIGSLTPYFSLDSVSVSTIIRQGPQSSWGREGGG